jgi:hypothetical protein
MTMRAHSLLLRVLVLGPLVACSNGSTDGGGGASGTGGASTGGAAGANDASAGSSGSGGSGAMGGAGATGGTSGKGGASGNAGAGGSGGATAGSGGGAGKGGAGTAGAGGAGTGGAGTGGGVGTDGGAGVSGASGRGGAAGGPGDAGGDAGLCDAIRTFEDGLLPSRELFVDAAATGGGDGSPGNPFATIAQAVMQATPGTAVRIRPGTYGADMFFRNLTGTVSAPIWIGGVPGSARPVIAGGGQAFHFVRPRYLIVHDLEVRGATTNGINTDDDAQYANADAARHVVFRNLFIHDIGSGGNQDCLKLSGLNDYWVLDSEFARCGGGGSGSAIDHVGCHQGVIARNVFSDLQGNGVQCKGGSDDIEVRRNRFTNGGERSVNMGGSTGTEFFRPPLSTTNPNFEARNIRVIANTFNGSTSPITFVGCVDCLALNNTIFNPARWIIRILQETVTGGGYTFTPAQNGRFINNLVYFARGTISAYVNVGPSTNASTFVFGNNLWFAHDMPASSRPTDLPSAETGGVAGVNPSLVDTAWGDFSLQSASPAIGAGRSAPELRSDVTGRCYADPPSIGAFERGSVGPTD